MKRRTLLLLLPMVLTAAVPAPSALAQHDSAGAQAGIGASVVPGLGVQKTQDLVVGAFRPGQSLGTVDLDVVRSTGSLAASRSASGGVSLAAGTFSAAQFNVTGPSGSQVHFAVVLPSSITIQRVGGSETMTVDRFRSNLSPDCAPGAPASSCPGSPYTLLVGATLHVDPNQRAGQYVGTFTVTVNQL
jgi:Domain of unknown function (DUF4402)